MRTISIKIGSQGHNWVAGLRWTSQDKELKPGEMRQETLRLGGNLYVARKPLRMRSLSEGSRYDVGYGSLSAEGRHGTYYSLGALLAQSRKGPWAATFDMGNSTFLYLAVLDGYSIDPEYGEVVGSRADVDKARDEYKDLDLAHTEYGFDDLKGFVDGFTGELASVKFLDGNKFSANVTLAIAGFVLVAVGLGGWAYMHHRLEVARMRAAAAAILHGHMHAPVAPVAVNPLTGTVIPSVLLNACHEAVSAIPVSKNGWVVLTVECGQGGAKVVWKPTAHAWNVGRPPGERISDGTIVSRIPFSLQVSVVGALVDSVDGEMAQLRDIVGRAGVDLDARSTPSLPGQQEASQQPSAPAAYRQQVFSVKLSWAPWSVPFDQVPGLRVDTIKYGFSGASWIVEGSVYGT